MTARQAVLDAFIRLEDRTGRTVFTIPEVIAEVHGVTTAYGDSTVRTYVVSVMCSNAPVHHANHADDLVRVDRGRYRRVVAGDDLPSREVKVAARSIPREDTSEAGEDERVDVRTEWHWEGNVQSVMVGHMAANGFSILAVANTDTKEHGIDIIALLDGRRVLVEVKGFPSKYYARGPRQGQVKKTPPTLQARVWFADAVMSSMINAGEEPDAEIVICFPDVTTYRSLAERTATGFERLGYSIAWVGEDGTVEWTRQIRGEAAP